MLDFFTENHHALTASELMESDPLQAGSKSPSREDESSLNNGSTPDERSSYLNCVQPQQKLAEGGGEASAQQTAQPVTADRGSLAAGGGGEAAEKEKQVPKPKVLSVCQPGQTPSARSAQQLPISASTSTSSNGHHSAPPTWQSPTPPSSLPVETQRQKSAWLKGCLFCAMWQVLCTSELAHRLFHEQW